jgi:hypothetical protein
MKLKSFKLFSICTSVAVFITSQIPTLPAKSGIFDGLHRRMIPSPTLPKDGGTTWIPDQPNNLTSVYFSSSYTKEEINYMTWVLTRLVSRAHAGNRASFYSCVAKFVNGNSPDNRSLRLSEIYSQLSSVKRIYLQKTINAPQRTLANAQLGSNPNNSKFFLININPIYLHSFSSEMSDVSRARTFVEDQEVMAGVLVHEMLHNLGYDHSEYSKTGKDIDRIGNFVYEAGWCIARKYKDKPAGTLGLTDASNYHVD